MNSPPKHPFFVLPAIKMNGQYDEFIGEVFKKKKDVYLDLGFMKRL